MSRAPGDPRPPAPPAPALGDVLDFERLLWAADHGLQATSRKLRAAIGLTGPQRLALRVIGCFPGLDPGQLAALLRLPRPGLSAILAGLTRRGLVERRPDPRGDPRERLGLTPRGRALDGPAADSVEAALERELRALPREQREAAAQVLAIVVARLAAHSP